MPNELTIVSKPINPNFPCISCKHSEKLDGALMCKHKHSPELIVGSGYTSFQTCLSMRRQGACGPDGVLYDKKDTNVTSRNA